MVLLSSAARSSGRSRSARRCIRATSPSWRPRSASRSARRRPWPSTRAALPGAAASRRRSSSGRAPSGRLTGLWTTTATLWERLRDEVARRNAAGTALLLMLDLDDFELVNDRFGTCRRRAAARGRARPAARNRQGVDFAARYGGEEFAVILPATESQPEGGGLTGRSPPPSASVMRSPACAPGRRPGLAGDHGEHRRRHVAAPRRQRRGLVAMADARSTRRRRAARTASWSPPRTVRAVAEGSRTSRPAAGCRPGRSTSSASTRTRPRRRTDPAP